eukprot:g7397.t1
MFSDRKTSTQALLEAGPSSGSPQPTSVESHLKDVVVDNPSNVLQASTLSSRIPKPRPLSVADDFEIVGGVPAFVWRRPQDYNPNYRTYAISFDGSRIAIREGRNRICVYDMLDNFSLVAEWEDSSRENIQRLTFHNNQNNELVVVFRDSTVALMHIVIKDEDALKESKSDQPQSKRMEINGEIRILDEYKDINRLRYYIANEGCETWVVMWDINVSNTINVLSIIQNKFRRLQIKSNDNIAPTFSYCSISQKALLLVYMRKGGSEPLETCIVHDIDFTKEVIDYSTRSIENGQSFGFSECGNYFLIWRHSQGGEDALELYEIQSLKQSLDPIARKSLGHGVVQVRANFIKSTSTAIEVFKLDIQEIPIVAFIVARVNQVKLLIWAPTTNAILKEIDLTMKESQERVSFLAQACFAIKQTKDGSKVSSLHASGVMVIDLNQRVVLCDVCYQVNLSQWLVPYIKNRGEDCFDVMSDGDAILLGWDTKNDSMLTLTKEMAEDEFKMMFEDEESITPIHLFGDFCKAFAFLEFNEDNQEVLSICVHNIKGNSTKRIIREQWNLQTTRVLNSMTHEDLKDYTLCFDENNGQLWIIGLKQRDATCHLIFLPINPYSMEGCIPSLYTRDYPRREIVNLDELTSQFGLSFFNTKFNGKTNFQLAFENKDKALMMKLLHYGDRHGLSLNDVFVRSFGEEFSNNFLKLAIENKNEAGVTLFFDLLEKRTLPFEQGASMLKDEFSNLWMHYRSILEPRIMSNFLERQICDIEVPIEVVGGSGSTEARMGTINSMDGWEQAANQGTITTYYKSVHGEALEHITKKGSNATTTAMVVVFTIASICKLGLNGIIRPLLMQEAPSHVFDSSLLKWVVEYKWNKIWKNRSWKSVVFYLVYMILYSVYGIWMTLARRHLGHHVVLGVCLSVLLFASMVFASILLYLEYVQMRTYIKDGKELFPEDPMWGLRKYWSSGWNIVEVVSYIMVITVIPSLHVANLLNLDVWSILSACIAIEAILIWMKVWYFAQAFEKTGAFVLMIENIIKDCVPFLGLALVILLGFSFALFILFQQALHEIKSIGNEGDNNETRDMIEQSFGDPWKATITMFYAMIGTFEPKIYHDSGSLSILITIMFVFYLAMQMIVMVNMLIAIMGDTFDRVKSTEEEQLLMGRARFIDACEAQLSKKEINEIESSIGEYLYVLLPKDEYVTDDIRMWQGRVKTIEDRVGKMIRDSDAKLLKKIEENNKEMKGDISELKKMKSDISELKKMKGDISELKKMKDDINELKKMKDDIDEIKQMLRNTMARDEGETISE